MNAIKIHIGMLLNKIPYQFIPIIGREYCRYKKEMIEYHNVLDKRQWIFNRVYNIVDFAIKNIKFYQDFYKEKGFAIDMLKSFDDINKIPIITKQDLMNVSLDNRSVDVHFRNLSNTGGSSGAPLTFYKLKKHKIKEMAYYHAGWERYGFNKSNLRLQFVGRQSSNGVKYELARNVLKVSVYEPFSNILKYLSNINDSAIVEYLQGYPSVIYEFALYCLMNKDEFEASNLKKSLKAIFLNSEYPHPTYRKKIEDVFCVRSIAGFGHTENLCMGMDFGSGEYEVQQSYGYSESIEMNDGIHLIGTSYDNIASPMIRYDTNDLMDEVIIEDGILKKIKMTNGGRNGQYVIDNEGKKISLTGLIFGKHHDLFKYCSQLQISQSENGKATIYYVPILELPKNFEPANMFDDSGINIEFYFKEISEPIRTKAGKVLLLVKEQ